jgi:hypothetical protein
MAKFTALILTQDGDIEEVEYDEKQSLATLQKAVGGMIESVSYWTKNIDAYVNEEFLYTEGLTLNPFGANIGQQWLGNIVIPKITDGKRVRLQKLGLLPTL